MFRLAAPEVAAALRGGSVFINSFLIIFHARCFGKSGSTCLEQNVVLTVSAPDSVLGVQDAQGGWLDMESTRSQTNGRFIHSVRFGYDTAAAAAAAELTTHWQRGKLCHLGKKKSPWESFKSMQINYLSAMIASPWSFFC